MIQIILNFRSFIISAVMLGTLFLNLHQPSFLAEGFCSCEYHLFFISNEVLLTDCDIQLPSICCLVDYGWNSSSLRPTPDRSATQEGSSVSSFHRIYGINLGWHSNYFLDSGGFLGDAVLPGSAAAICWAVLVCLSLPACTFQCAHYLLSFR